MKETTVPAAPGFYALFLSPKGLSIPRRFFRHAVVAWKSTRPKAIAAAT